MAVIRAVHRELVEKPSQVDKKYKPRKPSPAKWQLLQTMNHRDDPDARLRELYQSSEQEARMACTALQTLLWLWQEGMLVDIE